MNPETAPTDDSLVSLLDQLHGLREPPPVSMLPATPAWAVLAVVLLCGLALLLRLWLRHRRAGAYRRAALAELAGLEPGLAAGGAAALARLDALLRRTALAAFPRAEVAALTGPDWAAFLTRTGGPEVAAHVPSLAAATFAPRAPDVDGPALARAARHWIRHHHA